MAVLVTVLAKMTFKEIPSRYNSRDAEGLPDTKCRLQQGTDTGYKE